MTKKTMKFEEALELLEKRIKEMEGNNLSLEEAMAKYEEAIGLLNHCRKKLDEAEKKVSLLTPRNDEFTLDEMDES